MSHFNDVDRSLRTILDHATDGVLIEAGNSIVYANPAYATILGYRSARELMSATLSDIASPDDLDRLLYYGRCRETGKPAPARYTFRARRADAAIVSFDAAVSSARINGEVLITTIARPALQPVRSQTTRLTLPGLKNLSKREEQILNYLLAGRRSKEIAFILNISEKTVGTHRSRVFQKLAVRNDLELFKLASYYGMLEAPASELLQR